MSLWNKYDILKCSNVQFNPYNSRRHTANADVNAEANC